MTTELIKARMTPLKQIPAKGKNGKASFEPNPSRAFDVQFNPTTLKLTRSNNVDKGGATTNTQKRQMPSVPAPCGLTTRSRKNTRVTAPSAARPTSRLLPGAVNVSASSRTRPSTTRAISR